MVRRRTQKRTKGNKRKNSRKGGTRKKRMWNNSLSLIRRSRSRSPSPTTISPVSPIFETESSASNVFIDSNTGLVNTDKLFIFNPNLPSDVLHVVKKQLFLLVNTPTNKKSFEFPRRSRVKSYIL
jgi:hypothetical protein